MSETLHLWAGPTLLDLWREMHGSPRRLTLPSELESRDTQVAIEAAIAELEREQDLHLVVLLTTEPAAESGSRMYVFFEPMVSVVVAVNHAEHSVSIAADQSLWRWYGAHFAKLCARAEHSLRRGHLADAVLALARGVGPICGRNRLWSWLSGRRLASQMDSDPVTRVAMKE